METPCWSPSEGLQHGGRKPVETSGVYFGSLETFLLCVKLGNIRRIDIFVHVTCYSETMPMSRMWRNSVSVFSTQSSLRSKTDLKKVQQIFV